MLLRNVGNLLLLREEHAPAVVQVQSAFGEMGPPAAVVSPDLIANRETVVAPAGEGLLIPASAPAVIARAVSAPKSRFAAAASVAQVVLTGLYSFAGPLVLDFLLDVMTRPGALERIGLTHEGLSVAMFGALVWWRDARRRKKEAKVAQ